MIDYQIKADNKDITQQIKPYLLSIEVIDAIGDKADMLNLSLSDSHDAFALPTTSVTLSFSVFDDNKLISFGHFMVDEVTYQKAPTTIQVNAKSIPFDQTFNYQSMHDQKMRSFMHTTLEEVVATIAKEHGLKHCVSHQLADNHIQHIDQVNESNLSFLKRLTRMYKCSLKITYQRIILLDKEASSASGKAIKEIQLSIKQMSSFYYKTQKRNQYRCAIVPYYQLDQADLKEVKVGDKQPVYRATYVYESEQKALAVAHKILLEQQQKQDMLTFSLSGHFRLRAGQPIAIKGLQQAIPNNWLIVEARHKFDRNGYKTDIKAKLRN
ncbi:hypothetical protein L3V82_03490 [Thiotrichales bacterium 19S3-7]|nr:hypothetical protein [Thiotrichales bacterium 19S3-7]MCF6801290.1 hypothetical protein [Thiotrichales bacterium 19S3-11]